MLSFLALGLHMRMLADDYCLTQDIRRFGVLGNVAYQYTIWAGAYTDPLLRGLLYITLGLSAHSVALSLIYGLWWAGLFVLVRALLHGLGWPQATSWSALASSISLLAFLSAIPSRSILYWLGAMHYIASLALLAWIAASWLWAVQTPVRAALKHVLLALLTIALSGMHILYGLLALGLWLSLALSLWLLGQRRTLGLRLCLSAILANLASIVVILIAPGYWNRLEVTQALTSDSVSVVEALGMGLSATVESWASPFVLGHAGLLALVAMAACLALPAPLASPWAKRLCRHAFWLMILGLLWGLLASWGVLSLPALGSGRIATRVYAAVRALQLGFGLWVGLLLGLRLASAGIAPCLRLSLLSIALLGVSSLALYRLVDNVRLWPEYAAWAAQWDARHAALLEAAEQGAQRVLVAPFSATLPRLLGPATDDALVDWVRYCMHDFYGIANIEADSSVSAAEVLRVVEPMNP